MKRILFFIINFGIILSSLSQQVQLKGIVTVQNSKTSTGKIQYVKNAEIEHINENNAKTKDVTGDDGKFTLNIKGVKPNTQTQISVIPYGEYADHVVVNKKELQDITLGRVTPLSIYLCKKGELEQRQAEMIGINMRKLEERLEKDKKRLQNELEELKSKNDYLNVRYGQIRDSLDIISKNIDKAFERIKEYAQTMTLENLDDRDGNYVKA
jgi:molybdopterin converting factor small subunit